AVVQVLSAETDWIATQVPAQAILCNARGARRACCGVSARCSAGAPSRLPDCARDRIWRPRHLSDLGNWTVLVLGMGSIGRLLESWLRTLGAEVIGVASHAHD